MDILKELRDPSHPYRHVSLGDLCKEAAIELEAAACRERDLRNERDNAIAEIERLRASLVEIETSPQPHEDADRTEWKAAFFIATSLARLALAFTGEQAQDRKS